MVELLPCPWCNGEATLTSDGDPNWPIRIMDIHNEGCPLGFHQLQICYPDEATAAEAWNTRSTTPVSSDGLRSLTSGEIIGMTMGPEGTPDYAEGFKAGFASAMELVNDTLKESDHG